MHSIDNRSIIRWGRLQFTYSSVPKWTDFICPCWKCRESRISGAIKRHILVCTISSRIWSSWGPAHVTRRHWPSSRIPDKSSFTTSVTQSNPQIYIIRRRKCYNVNINQLWICFFIPSLPPNVVNSAKSSSYVSIERKVMLLAMQKSLVSSQVLCYNISILIIKTLC